MTAEKVTSDATIEYTTIEYDTILFCAFRYALGRHTYVVSDIAGAISENLHNLSPATKSSMMKEIRQHLTENDGWEMDNRIWKDLLNELEDKGA